MAATALMFVALQSHLAIASSMPSWCKDSGIGYGCATMDLSVGEVRGNRWAHGEEFLTIPYASITKRFDMPELRESLPQKPFDATNIQPIGQDACMQPGPPFTPGSGELYGVEDCLIMNIYKPHNHSSVGKRPILVWIFGGDNAMSEIIPYNATKLAGEHDAIVAVVSYRLALLGFAAFAEDYNNGVSTGNGGMHDVIAAIRWLKKEAANLGADPNNIVAFGESSGGTDAQIMTLSPLADGLVQGSISESGGLYANDVHEQINATRELADLVGCDVSDNTIKQCLAEVSGKDLWALVNNSANYSWGPTVDGVFLSKQPLELLHKGKLNPGVSVLWGGNTNDSTKPFMLEMHLNKHEYVEFLNDTISGYGPFLNMMDESQPKAKISGSQHHRRLRALNSAGVRNESMLQKALALYPPHPESNNADLIGWVLSDQFLCNVRREILSASRAVSQGGKAYMYRFDWFFQSHKSCIADSNYHTPRSGSNHCDEMTFVYGQPIFDNQDPPGYSYTNCSDPASKYYDKERCVGCYFDLREARLSSLVGQYWTSFARDGSPYSLEAPSWPAFTESLPENIVLHPGEIHIEQNLGREEACVFWDSISSPF